jgi:hypothetical protein
VTAGDYDGDGDLDLFVVGRITPNKYPTSPKSYLLENVNGKFKDVSHKLGAEQGCIGMVTSALWTDINGDLLPDLIIVGEYMPITIMINQKTSFANKTGEYLLSHTNGWWNSIQGADLDQDGDIDYVVGNYGLNSFFKPTQEQPVEIYGNDYDKDGSFDPITTVYIQDESYIFHPRNLMIEQIPSFANRFRTFEKYSTTPFNRSFTGEEISSSIHLECNMLQSIILEKTDRHSFKIHPLPIKSQFAPIYGMVMEDLNHDHLPDLFLIGNSYAEETVYGYYDASFGSVLLNLGNFNWQFLENNMINLIADGDKKALAKMYIGNERIFLLTENNGDLQALAISTPSSVTGKIIELEDNDWYCIFEYENGMTAKTEFYHGSGYLSQETRKLHINSLVKQITIVNYSGESRTF